MKFGCCAGMPGGGASGVGAENIPMLKRAGFDYVEFALSGIAALSEEAFMEGPVRMLEENDFPCRACNGFLPGSIRLTGDSVDRQAAIRYAKDAFARAERIGVKYVVFGSSGARNFPNGFGKAKAIEQMRQWLKAFGDLAGERGITLVIEPLNPFESNMVNKFLHGLALIGQVNHPAVAALADYYHMRMSGDSMEDLLYAGGSLRHMHIASTLGRALPMPQDGDDYNALFAALGEIGYEGGISIEGGMKPGQGEAALAESLRYLKSFVK